jgi:hypothetical protein
MLYERILSANIIRVHVKPACLTNREACIFGGGVTEASLA